MTENIIILTPAHKPHPHFDLMVKYVEIAQTTDKPWEAFQVKGFVDEWLDVSAAILFNENLQYRLKPEPPNSGFLTE